MKTNFYFKSYPWPFGEIIRRAALHRVPTSMCDCASSPWPLECPDNGEGVVDNGDTSSNGDGNDDVDGTVGDGEGADATNRGGDVIGGSTCLAWDGMLATTSIGEVIGVGVGVGTVIFST